LAPKRQNCGVCGRQGNHGAAKRGRGAAGKGGAKLTRGPQSREPRNTQPARHGGQAQPNQRALWESNSLGDASSRGMLLLGGHFTTKPIHLRDCYKKRILQPDSSVFQVKPKREAVRMQSWGFCHVLAQSLPRGLSPLRRGGERLDAPNSSASQRPLYYIHGSSERLLQERETPQTQRQVSSRSSLKGKHFRCRAGGFS
jgi:hypothetical protein